MINKVNIALAVPSSGNLNRHMYLRLKRELNNEPCQYAMPPRILAVSDIEGNFLAFRRQLLKNGVMNTRYEWTFGEGHLVMAGDCFDRGEQVMECLWLIYSLEEKARKKGGYVHFILGNHEIMNLNGDWRYAHPKYATITGSRKVLAALYDGNNELWRWLRTKNIMEKIGDILFVHGGVSDDLVRSQASITDINDCARPFYDRAGESFSNQLLRTIFDTDTSPFWYRGFYQPGFNEESVKAAMKHFGVSTIVTGHTVTDKISGLHNGKVINLNTNAGDGVAESLLVRSGHFYRVESTGRRVKIK